MVIERFAIYLVELDPTKGSEIAKTRPCVIVSPDVVNQRLRTVIVAPLTSTIKPYPTRINSEFDGKVGQVALDQVRVVDKSRLRKHLGDLADDTSVKVSEGLVALFSY
jgi:mRNA interferase MazF